MNATFHGRRMNLVTLNWNGCAFSPSNNFALCCIVAYRKHLRVHTVKVANEQNLER
jgi:hypothetical protein